MLPLLLLTFLQGIEVDGLRPGESFELLPVQKSHEDFWARGRLLNALDYTPIPGARLEAWLESYPSAGTLLGSATTGADGRFRLKIKVGGREAHKVTVRAPGYRSSTWSDSAVRAWDEDFLLLPLGEPERYRVLDLDLRPVSGARLEIHQSCSHDPPAFEAWSDDDGRIEVPDIPGWHDHESPGDLKLLAPGFGSLASISRRDTLAVPGVQDEVRLYVPRRRPVMIRALDRDGRPLQKQRLVLIGSPEWTDVWTDEDGVAMLPTTFDDRWLSWFHADSVSEERYFAGCRVPLAFTDRPMPLRQDGEEVAEAIEGGLAAGRLEVGLEGVPEQELARFPLQVIHEDGWLAEGPGPHRLPAGAVTVVAGAAFSGWEEQSLQAEVVAGQTAEVAFRPRREARVRILVRSWGTLHVQAGDDSISLEGSREDQEQWKEVHVPTGQPITALYDDGGALRATLPPLAPGEQTELDLTAPGHRSARSVCDAWQDEEVPTATLVFAVADEFGQPVPEARLDLEPFARPLGGDGDHDPPARSYTVAASVRGEVLATAEGYLPRWAAGVSPPAGVSAPVRLPLQPDASVQIEHGEEVETYDGFAAGPRELIHWFPDGSRLLLRLELAAGERRTIQVKPPPPEGD